MFLTQCSPVVRVVLASNIPRPVILTRSYLGKTFGPLILILSPFHLLTYLLTGIRQMTIRLKTFRALPSIVLL